MTSGVAGASRPALPPTPRTADGPSGTATRGPVRRAVRTAATVGLLTAVAPANAALCGLALLRSLVVTPERDVAAQPRTILVSGGKMTKALQLARSFHRAGHRVVLVETWRYRLTGHRFSRAVDAFHVVPGPEDPGFADALADVVRREGVDVFVPVSSPASSVPEARAREVLDPLCEVVHLDAHDVAVVDDKASFAAAARELGLPVPESHRIEDPRQVLDFDFAARPDTRYVLKSIPYDPVRRLDLTLLPLRTPEATAAYVDGLPISAATPFVLQEFVAGEEFCTHSTVRDGRVRVHGCCRSSAFQLRYEMVDDPEIDAWVRRFVGGLGLTGQVSLDLIRGHDGVARAIECNPRTHSAITMFHDHPGLADGYLEDDGDELRPRAGSRPTYWLYHELGEALRDPRSIGERLRTIARGSEAIFRWDDPLPFLLVHHLQIPALLLGNLVRGRDWLRIDVNIGKLVEPAGD